MSDMIDRAAAIAEIRKQIGEDNECTWTRGNNSAIAACSAALRALPAVQVGVKPLEWADEYRPMASPEHYQIWPDNGGSGAPDDPIETFDGFMLYSPHMIALGVYQSIEAAKAAAQADYAARIRSALTAQPSPDVAGQFNSADWSWRTMDPDDCGDSPSEAINRGMVGLFCVCEIASSFTGPTRYGFLAPALDPESDDEEFVHFATQQEALDAAKARADLSRAGGEG